MYAVRSKIFLGSVPEWTCPRLFILDLEPVQVDLDQYFLLVLSGCPNPQLEFLQRVLTHFVTPGSIFHCVSWVSANVTSKNRQCLEKLPKYDFTNKMKDLGNFCKLSCPKCNETPNLVTLISAHHMGKYLLFDWFGSDQSCNVITKGRQSV